MTAATVKGRSLPTRRHPNLGSRLTIAGWAWLRFRVRLRTVVRLTANAPKRVQVAVIIAAVYSVSPLELIPSIIPVIGVVDEAIVIGITVWYVRRHAPEVADALALLIPDEGRALLVRIRATVTGWFRR